MSQARVQALQAEVLANGHTFTLRSNPMFEAILAKEAKHNELRSLAGVDPVPPADAFAVAAKSMLGLKLPADLDERIKAHRTSRPRHLMAGPVEPIPRKFSLRDKGVTGKPRYQKQCGSCWNFGAFRGIESAYRTANPSRPPDAVDFSRQDVLDCASSGGCDGDWAETTLKFIKEHGAVTEADCPYTATSGSGRCSTAKKYFPIKDFGYVGDDANVPTLDQLKAKIIQHGCALPVAVAVDQYWGAYGGGVFRGTTNDPRSINHEVYMTGWNDDEGTIEIGNHWEGWGEDGYMRCVPGANLIGYAAMWVEGACDSVAPAPIPPVPPAPPVPVADKKYPIELAGTVAGLFGSHTSTMKGFIVIPGNTLSAFLPKEDCGCKDGLAAQPVQAIPFSLILEVMALLQSPETLAAFAAGKKIVADVRAKDYAQLAADVQAGIPAAVALAVKIKAIIVKAMAPQALGKFGDGSWLAAFLAVLPSILSLIAAFKGGA